MARLDFKGKAFVQNHHLTLKYHHLVPNKAASLTDKVSLHDNLIIHGDNLVALKALLPTYAGKVKCIYIDPPYNTGNEGWVYNDNVNSPMMKEWLGKVVDKEDLTRHDKWLCMMMPRLKLLHELLSVYGILFVSIDHNEAHHLKMLLDEVFTESNFVGTIIWKGATDNNPTQIATEHEYIYCFAKNKPSILSIWKNKTSNAKEIMLSEYERLKSLFQADVEKIQQGFRQFIKANYESLNPITHYNLVDSKGIYTGSRKVHNPKLGGYKYDVIHSNGKVCTPPANGYRYPKKAMDALLEEDRIIFGKNEIQVIQIKEYLIDYEAKLSSVILLDSRTGSNDLQALFPGEAKPFPNPKPVDLIHYIFGFCTEKDDIILDSFAGSGTTAQAVLSLNKEAGGGRKFILIETENYAETLTAERVRRVIQGVPNSKDESLKKGLGGAFSFFDLGEPIEMQAILQGDNLPTYEELARYVFYTATGEEFDPSQIDLERKYIGTSKDFEVYLFYQPDLKYPKATALNLQLAEQLGKDKKKLVFAPMKYLDQDHLNDYKIDYCQLPFEIYKSRN